MNNEVESYVGELKELRLIKKQNEELKHEINNIRNRLDVAIRNECKCPKPRPARFSK